MFWAFFLTVLLDAFSFSVPISFVPPSPSGPRFRLLFCPEDWELLLYSTRWLFDHSDDDRVDDGIISLSCSVLLRSPGRRFRLSFVPGTEDSYYTTRGRSYYCDDDDFDEGDD
jgi:hypothetical protein